MSYGSTPGGNPAEEPPGSGGSPAPGQYGVPGQYGAPGPYGAPGQHGAQGQYGAPGQFGAPGPYGMPGQYGPPPPSHLGWAITALVGGVLFSLILGFPAGLVASRYARKVGPQWNAGDQQGAIKASRSARSWAIASTVLDVLGLILVGILIYVGSTASSSNYNNPAVVAASIKTQLQKRISDPSSPYYSPGVKVTSVVCKSSGQNTDACTDYFSNGQTAKETAVISANGQDYKTTN